MKKLMVVMFTLCFLQNCFGINVLHVYFTAWFRFDVIKAGHDQTHKNDRIFKEYYPVVSLKKLVDDQEQSVVLNVKCPDCVPKCCRKKNLVGFWKCESFSYDFNEYTAPESRRLELPLRNSVTVYYFDVLIDVSRIQPGIVAYASPDISSSLTVTPPDWGEDKNPDTAYILVDYEWHVPDRYEIRHDTDCPIGGYWVVSGCGSLIIGGQRYWNLYDNHPNMKFLVIPPPDSSPSGVKDGQFASEWWDAELKTFGGNYSKNIAQCMKKVNIAAVPEGFSVAVPVLKCLKLFNFKRRILIAPHPQPNAHDCTLASSNLPEQTGHVVIESESHESSMSVINNMSSSRFKLAIGIAVPVLVLAAGAGLYIRHYKRMMEEKRKSEEEMRKNRESGWLNKLFSLFRKKLEAEE
ncbi:MAG: hypothetical protein LBL71_02850 [Endomicrobium sp.]|jgi:hypothetical protein|nr:hypothetical protein [Endomicrobium sp.]